ncbi:hypothetical protein I4U23_025682 [Adineta vaga]|nr:hypothetical protein I4U23_025682 [Adineta vaga]
MYQDAGYGQNWQPMTNNARRIDPYTRSIKTLGILFTVGFVLIIIVVLSLIPLYISQNSTSSSSNVQVPKVSMSNYNLRFQSPGDNFNSQTIISDLSNRRNLQAALTSLIQTDSTMTGSIVEINTSSSVQSRRKRRQSSKLLSISFELNVISSKSCTSVTCLNQFQSRAQTFLTDINRSLSGIRYQNPNSTETYWLNYKLPQTTQTNSTFIVVDPKSISSTLDTLLQLDKSLNQPTSETSTSTTIS